MQEKFTIAATTFKNSLSELNSNEKLDVLMKTSKDLLELINVIDLSVLKPAVSDINSNMKQLNKVADKSVELAELLKGCDKPTYIAVLWLIFTYEFFVAFFFKIVNDDSEIISDIAKPVYQETLRPHHSKMVQFVFDQGLKMLPKRSKLGIQTTADLQQIFEASK